MSGELMFCMHADTIVSYEVNVQVTFQIAPRRLRQRSLKPSGPLQPSPDQLDLGIVRGPRLSQNQVISAWSKLRKSQAHESECGTPFCRRRIERDELKNGGPATTS